MKLDTENIIVVKSKTFALKAIKLYRHLIDEKREYVLSRQFLRSATSIGANVKEAIRGQSNADFGTKMNIALKEADETAYWLRLLKRTGYLSLELFDSIYPDITEIIAILISSIRTAKGDNPKE